MRLCRHDERKGSAFPPATQKNPRLRLNTGGGASEGFGGIATVSQRLTAHRGGAAALI